MPKLFVSYAHEDSKFVDQLVNDLDFSTNLKIAIDKRCLSSGDSLTKIFAEIGTSDFLMPIISSKSIRSNWCQKELRVAIVKSIEEQNFKIIPLIAPKQNWQVLSKDMPTDIRVGLIDTLASRFDKEEYGTAFKKLIVALSPKEDAEAVYYTIIGPESNNPFRRVRAEHFMDCQVFANLFAEPERDYGTLVSPKPTLIEGCRGSGKTMLLKSLNASIAPLIRHCDSFKDSNCNYFGVYLRLSRDTFATLPDGLNMDEKAVQGIFYDELILRLAQSLLDEIYFCITSGLFKLDRTQERKLCDDVLSSLRLEGGISEVSDLRQKMADTVSLIIDYIRARGRGDKAEYKVKSLTKDNLYALCERVRVDIPDLKGCCIYFLVDEYENLKEFQKTVVNTLIKWHDARYYSFKVAYKNTGFKTGDTLEAQPLEEGPDYSLINLDFDIRNDKARFVKYIKNICARIMKEEGFKSNEIDAILEKKSEALKTRDFGLYSPTVEQIHSEVRKMVEGRGKNWERLSSRRKKLFLSHFSVAAQYRLLGPRRRAYGGFDSYVLLSSGIVRNFLELCGMAYYFAHRAGSKVKEGEKISVEHQTEAAYTLSEYQLWVISKNVTFLGPTLFNFIVDIGEILRQKLLNHLSEPEALVISVRNLQLLDQIRVKIVQEKDERTYSLRQIIDTALLHSILLEYKEKPDRKLKQRYSLSYGLLINRIYAPALRISPRSRWLKIISPEEIRDLLNFSTRTQTRKQLIEKAVSEVTSSRSSLLKDWGS